MSSALQMFSRLLEWEYIRNRRLAAAGVAGIVPIFSVNVLGMVGEHVIFFSKSALDGTMMRPVQHQICLADAVERCGRCRYTLQGQGNAVIFM